MVYVDDFKLSGPAGNMIKGWSLIRHSIQTDEPQPVNKCLGCEHTMVDTKVRDAYLTLSKMDRSSLKFAATPFLDEDKVAEDCAKDPEGTKGTIQPIASSVLMKVLYAARLSRFYLLKAVANLAQN
eukprot:15670646-Heterocapsa_arctica.AAC.1